MSDWGWVEGLVYLGCFMMGFIVSFVGMGVMSRYKTKKRRMYFNKRLEVLNKRERGLSCVHVIGFGFREEGTMVRCEVHGYPMLSDCEECEDYKDSKSIGAYVFCDEEKRYRYRMYELDEDRWLECYMAVQSLPLVSKVRVSAYNRRENYLEIIVRGDSIMDSEIYRASKGAISRRVIDMDVTDLVGEDGLGAWRKRVWEEIDRLTKREWVERVIDSYGRNPVVKTDRERDLEDMGSFGGPEKREWITEDICRLVILLGEEVEYKKLLKDKMNGDVKEYNVGVMNGLMLARGALINILGRDKTDDAMEWAYYKWYGYHGGRRFAELLKKKVGKDFYHVERSEEGDEE